jgi:hypothetical protein
MTRHAACNCGQLHLTIEGEPSRIAMCHCLECQRRTGAASVIKRAFGLNRSRLPARPRHGRELPKAATS